MMVHELIVMLQRVNPDALVLTSNGDIGTEYVEATQLEDVFVRPAEWSEGDIYVRTGETWPDAREAVIL